MTTKKLLIILLILVSFFTGFTQAQVKPAMLVQGIVSDSLTAETIPYATLRISKQATPNKVDQVVPTDENGKFQFSMNQVGEYLLSIEFIGKEPAIRPFVLTTNQTLNLGNIFMKDNSKMLNEVVVSAQKSLIKVDLDKITYSLEDDPESKTNNALDMMKKVPMITVDGEDNIQLKGSSAYKIYINGKPSSMLASNPKDVLKSMPASTIKDIEVITDPGAKYDAEGVAGIINIITQKNAAMGGYTATINSWLNSQGGYSLGGYLTAKKGKFGFTGNYNYYEYRSPESESGLRRENFKDLKNKYLIQNGTGKNKGNGQYGNGELSYEIDSLNLINIGFGRYAGDGEQKNFMRSRVEDASLSVVQESEQSSKRTYKYGSTELKADYQMTSKTVKDRLLTVSYRLALEPNDWGSDNEIKGILGIPDSKNKQYSDGDQKEHTMQVDYATPFAKIHNLEAGLKYIIRLNGSNSRYQFLDESGSWVDRPSLNDEFKHRQNIYSLYGSYAVKLKKFGVKAGMRYEGTDMKVKYPLNEGTDQKDFDTNLSNLVPSVTVSYQLGQFQSLRLGYNMRISRPGIWQLNPFENTTDSLNSSVGNPNLKPIESHTINLNYNFFNPKFNMNASLSYTFVDNSIERITELDGNVSRTTYDNIGKSRKLGLYTYFSWSPTSKVRLSGNLSGTYTDVKSNSNLLDYNLSNSGFMMDVYSNVQYTLPKAYRINAYVGGSTPYVNIQGREASYHYYGLSLSKGFLAEKLNVNISASNMFSNEQKFKNVIDNPTFRTESFNNFKRRYVSVSVSYRFGEMKAQIKKAVRGITNDDSMGGGQGGNASQGGGGQ